jgi:hypothetical protein
MADCEWAILCDYSFLDVNRKTCIIGVFDRIMTANVPSALPHAALALKFTGRSGEQVNAQIQILRPTGGQLAAFQVGIKLPENGSIELQLNIANLALPDYGAYAFNIYEQAALLKTITFLVERPPQQQVPPTPPVNP